MKYQFTTTAEVRHALEAARSCDPQARIDVWSSLASYLAWQTVNGSIAFKVLAALRDASTSRATLVQLGRAGFRVHPIRATLAALAVTSAKAN